MKHLRKKIVFAVMAFAYGCSSHGGEKIADRNAEALRFDSATNAIDFRSEMKSYCQRENGRLTETDNYRKEWRRNIEKDKKEWRKMNCQSQATKKEKMLTRKTG